MNQAGSTRSMGAGLAFIAVLAVPLFVNPASARMFDPDRAIVLRIFGLLAVFALAVGSRWPGAAALLRGGGGTNGGVGLYFVGSLIACLVATAPQNALAGDYPRQMGLLTDLALVGIFAGVAVLRERTHLSLALIKGLLCGGVAHSLLAIFEALASPHGRASGLAGGPTFLGTHLALLLPLAVALCNDRRGIIAPVLLAAGLVASGSRVAWFAAIVGCSVVALLRGGAFARRVVLIAAAACLVIIAAALPPIAAHLPPGSLPSRVGELFARHGGDIEQRLLLYRDAASAIRSDPIGSVLGHGPDSIGVTFASGVSEELQRRVGGRARIDRFHCDALDLLYTRGLLGLAGMTLVVGCALRRGLGRRGTDPLAIPLCGLLAAAIVDSLLSVPGVVSRVLVFTAAGCLAARIDDHSGARWSAESKSKAITAGCSFGVLALTLGFATHGDARLAAAIAFVPLLGNGGLRTAASWTALPALVFALHAILAGDGTPSDEVDGASLRLGLLCATLIGMAWPIARQYATSGDAKPAGFVPSVSRKGLGAIASLVLASALFDDARRIHADHLAAVATRLHHESGRAALAVPLLDDATALAPEVARYALRAAAAEVDTTEAISSERKAEFEHAFVRVSERVHLASLRAPHDGVLLAEGSDLLLRLAERLPAHRAQLVAHASRLGPAALGYAPTSLPVLQATARLALALGDTARADELLGRALAIDNTPGLTHILLGRSAARRGDLANAAWNYSLALPTGIGRPEALAGIALAAAAQGGAREAGHLLCEIAEIEPPPGDLRASIEGARPLLRRVAWHDLMAAFGAAEAEWNGDRRRIVAVRTALDY